MSFPSSCLIRSSRRYSRFFILTFIISHRSHCSTPRPRHDPSLIRERNDSRITYLSIHRVCRFISFFSYFQSRISFRLCVMFGYAIPPTLMKRRKFTFSILEIRDRKYYKLQYREMLRLTDRRASRSISSGIVYADPDPHSYSVTIQ